ncbi:DUF3558 domain-containing protein [Nocardia abscessus]|uniref:DUF3558 domain-containing protein n=1 Tax=Nocardia abscessus TaxID=120957 RepID=UPI00313E69CD
MSSSQLSPPMRPTLTAARLQPPSQDNEYTSSGGRAKVVVDPCTWVPDDVVRQTGFDPSSRRRSNDLVAEYIFLTCAFTSFDDRSLELDSGNVTLEEVGRKYMGKTRSLIVNGRDALISQKTDEDDCSLDMRTKVGYFGVSVTVHSSAKMKGLNPCDGIEEIAKTLEPTIGKDN